MGALNSVSSFTTQLHGLPFWAALILSSIPPAFVAAFGWAAKRIEARSQERNVDERSTSKVIDTLQAELDRAYTMLRSLQPQIDELAQARFRLLNVVSEIYAAAVAGRAMIHDLERQLGRPETQFSALPEIPLGGQSERS